MQTYRYIIRGRLNAGGILTVVLLVPYTLVELQSIPSYSTAVSHTIYVCGTNILVMIAFIATNIWASRILKALLAPIGYADYEVQKMFY